ncbi:MAG: hypothetical protein DMG79_12775 [Acidobacteria bacterium]|nr:MAG: hypothetical protein DMG79_12775 [Acidobacteriota bacterium]
MAAPPLIYEEDTVKAETYYVTINLGGNDAPKPITGIFVPENYKVSSDVDIVLWLMGHHDNSEYPAALTIDDYWFKYPHFRFREFVNVSNKNVILVAPSLGPHSQSGNLASAGGLSTYLDQVLSALEAYGPFSGVPTLDNLVIACHSGGGAPMLGIATTSQRYSDNIRQLWVFDCIYGAVEDTWLKWAQQNSKKILFIRYGSSTPERSKTLMRIAAKQSNINVDGDESTPHNRVPTTYWNRFMRRANIFGDK